MFRFICTGVPSRWHCPQTNGIFNAATAEFLSLTGRMSWLPWQSTQCGASASPRAIALPCSECGVLLLLVAVAGAAVHPGQGVAWGRSLPSRSAWQEVQESEPWTEAENFLPSTKQRDRLRPALGGQALVAVAGQAVVVADIGRRGRRRCAAGPGSVPPKPAPLQPSDLTASPCRRAPRKHGCCNNSSSWRGGRTMGSESAHFQRVTGVTGWMYADYE